MELVIEISPFLSTTNTCGIIVNNLDYAAVERYYCIYEQNHKKFMLHFKIQNKFCLKCSSVLKSFFHALQTTFSDSQFQPA